MSNKLGSYIEFKNGLNYSKEDKGDGCKVVGVADFKDNLYIDFDNLEEVKSEIVSKEMLLDNDDLLFVRSNGNKSLVGRCIYISNLKEKVSFSGFTIRGRIKNKKELSPKYFLYYCISPIFKKSLYAKIGNGTNIRNLTQTVLEDICINLPKINDQNKVADCIDKITKKIEINNKINKELEKLAKTLYDYWFVQFDFPDENGKPYKSSGGAMIYNEKLKREIPQNWQDVTLKELCEVKSGYPFSSNDYIDDGKYKLITIKNVQDNYISSNTDNKIDKLPANMPDYCILRDGDILLSLTGNVGRIGMVFENNLLLNQRVGLLKLTDINYRSFIYSTFLSKHFVNILENIATGSNQKNLSPIETEKLLLPYSEKIIKDFEAHTKPLVDQIINNYKENKNLEQLRDFLLPMLINGQITVINPNEDDLSEDKIIKKSLDFWHTHGKMDIDLFARENGILVYKDNEQKKGAVSYNKEKDLYEIAVKDPRDNFTIAHEIGHILKHKKELKNGTLGRKSEESGSKLMEYEADSLAAEILMPEEYVLQYMQDENKTDKEFLDEKFIKECAKHFDVNPPAMNIRLKNLGFKVPYLK